MNTKVLNTCNRVSLIINNISFFGFGAYLLIDSAIAKSDIKDADFSESFYKDFNLVLTTMIILGSLMIIVSVIGFIAGVIANQIALIVYETGLIILFILHIFNLIIYIKLTKQYFIFALEPVKTDATVLTILNACFLALELIYIISVPLLILRFKKRGNQVLL